MTARRTVILAAWTVLMAAGCSDQRARDAEVEAAKARVKAAEEEVARLRAEAENAKLHQQVGKGEAPGANGGKVPGPAKPAGTQNEGGPKPGDGATPPGARQADAPGPEPPGKKELVGVWEGRYQGLNPLWVQILELKAAGNFRWQQEVRRPEGGGRQGARQELSYGKWKYEGGELILDNEWRATDALGRPIGPKVARFRIRWEGKDRFITPPPPPSNFPLEWKRVSAN
jgi:hypothetical protein